MLILLRFTQRIHVSFCLNMSSSLVSGIVVAIIVYVCVGQRFQNRGEVLLCVFVLMLSNINIVWQKIA